MNSKISLIVFLTLLFVFSSVFFDEVKNYYLISQIEATSYEEFISIFKPYEIE